MNINRRRAPPAAATAPATLDATAALRELVQAALGLADADSEIDGQYALALRRLELAARRFAAVAT